MPHPKCAIVSWCVGISLLCSCAKSEIASNLDEEQARTIINVLSNANIPVEKSTYGKGKEQRYRIEVPRRHANEATQITQVHGLPKPTKQGFQAAYHNSSMVPSPEEERARFSDALSSEIAAHLMRLPGVINASVIVSIPPSDPLAPSHTMAPQSTASVLLTLGPNVQALPPHGEIQKLVAGAVSGMHPEDVALLTAMGPSMPTTPIMSRLGPLVIATRSKSLLLSMFIGLGAVIITLALWVMHAERRLVRMQATK